MFSNLSWLGRTYKKLPPHRNLDELATNIERIADALMDKSLGSFAGEGYLKAPNRWEWRLGKDLKTLAQYARDFAPEGADGLHHYLK